MSINRDDVLKIITSVWTPQTDEIIHKIIVQINKLSDIEQKTCDGCLYDKMGVIPPYICLRCTRFYTDKYTSERGD